MSFVDRMKAKAAGLPTTFKPTTEREGPTAEELEHV